MGPWPGSRRRLGAEDAGAERRDARHPPGTGGRYLTLVGSNKLFHLPQDRWPQAVDVAAVARIAAAAARIANAITR